MEGGKKTNKSKKKGDKQEGKTTPEIDNARGPDEDTTHSLLHSIGEEIRNFRAEHKVDLHKLKDEIKEDMKS